MGLIQRFIHISQEYNYLHKEGGIICVFLLKQVL